MAIFHSYVAVLPEDHVAYDIKIDKKSMTHTVIYLVRRWRERDIAYVTTCPPTWLSKYISSKKFNSTGMYTLHVSLFLATVTSGVGAYKLDFSQCDERHQASRNPSICLNELDNVAHCWTELCTLHWAAPESALLYSSRWIVAKTMRLSRLTAVDSFFLTCQCP